jgi:hypothetical protein
MYIYTCDLDSLLGKRPFKGGLCTMGDSPAED